MNGSEGDVDRARSLLRALANTEVTVLYSNPDLTVRWAENVPQSWSKGDVSGKTCHDLFPGPVADRVLAAKNAAFAMAAPQHLEISLQGSDGFSWFSLWIDPDRRPDGGVQGLVTTAVDITDQKRREQTLRTLLREVAHRSKNLLAIIQSIATQTGRHSGTIETFLSRFRGRLQSLASSQDLVTTSNWRGADLRELVLGQVTRYTTDTARSIRFEGATPYLNPNAALHIGLAIHELAVNSISYGALAVPDGFVTLSSELVGEPPMRALRLNWSERVSIGDQEIGRKRFGSVTLERVVPASLNGSASLVIGSDRLDYTLLAPRDNFEIE